MRELFMYIFSLIIVGLGICVYFAFLSPKPIGKSVGWLIASLIPAVFGNLLIVSSNTETSTLIGCYCYYIGMDLVMLALLRYTREYCSLDQNKRAMDIILCILLAADVIQYVCNPFFGQAFTLEAYTTPMDTDFRMIPHIGQYYHRILDYSIILSVMGIFLLKALRAARIYAERYWVIVFSMFIGTAWQTFSIISRDRIDKSMIGFGAFGVLVFYFTLYYRPMRLLDQMLAGIASRMPEALFFFDASDHCIWANEPAMQLAGGVEKNFEAVTENLHEMFGDLRSKGDEWTEQFVLGEKRNPKYYTVEKHTVTDEKGRPAGNFLNVRDTTEETLRIKHEIFTATHDGLTGLYNRESLYSGIQKLLPQHPDVSYLIIFLDVKNFKIVNDLFSNAFGDYALRCIAQWIRSQFSANSIYGRLGGDTFGICVPANEFDEAHFEEELGKFVVMEGTLEYHILIHLGVFRIIDTRLDVAVMFDRAHLALSTIRDEYQKHVAFYDNNLRDKVLWDQHISSQLHEAIETRQLRPFLQPIVDRTGRIVGAEALARWIHPTDGFLSPGSFIPVFEKNGMIVEVDRHMWRCSCEILRDWKSSPAHRDLFISVNISPKDFYFIDVLAEIKGLVKEFGIDSQLLRIEITETVMMTDADERMKIISAFREAGFIVEMDDFGSGYSSLNLLKDMPVDVLKIDMKFLSKARDEQKSQTIVQNIINLSDDLGISSLTEGVETEEQYHMLSQMRCRLFQGYFFAKPMPLEDFESFCNKHIA
ncbi:MAG: EAL domain-containing protein [Oscillospiraceae bacterium]|nr:EAL domain-containing protein [Oscillospiraceae bacterium]